MKSKNFIKFLLTFLLLSMAISPAFALGEGGINLFLIGVMTISPMILLVNRKFYKNDIWLLIFMLSIILIPYINHSESMRWSTVIFSLLFCSTFLAYKNLLYANNFSILNYQKLLKYLIYAYFLVLLIQQFCVLTGLPIFNVSNYHINEPWKLNTLTSEPSHSARIVALLMYCYIEIKETVDNKKYNFYLNIKKDKWVWIAFIWTMATMGSGTAFLFILLVLLKFIKFRNLVPLFILFGILVFIVEANGIDAFQRTFKTTMATLTLDTKLIFEADGSAAYRILPLIVLAKMVSFFTFDGWFGHGIDHVASFLSDYVPGLPIGWTGGGLLQLWIDFGFLSFLLFLGFHFVSFLKKGNYLDLIFWFMLVFIQGINNQILWLCIMLLFTNNFFKQISKKRNIYRSALENKNI